MFRSPSDPGWAASSQVKQPHLAGPDNRFRSQTEAMLSTDRTRPVSPALASASPREESRPHAAEARAPATTRPRQRPAPTPRRRFLVVKLVRRGAWRWRTRSHERCDARQDPEGEYGAHLPAWVVMTRPVRCPREPPDDSPTSAYPEKLGAGRRHIDALRVHHLDLTRRFLDVADRQLYTLDLFLGAAMARSYSLVDGFISAFDSWNPIVAAPLLRMQIDSLVRLSYTAHAPSAQVVAEYVIGGGEFRNLKASDGHKLTDRHLVDLAQPFHPWVPDVYSATSGWVHFSPEHLRAAWRLTDQEDHEGNPELRIEGSIPLRPQMIGLEPMRQLLAAMITATKDVFGYVEMWEARKGLPLGESRELEERLHEAGPDS
jgi:hypothetical protein